MKPVDSNTRWRDLPNNTVYPLNKNVLITSTNVRRSTPALMHLSRASFVASADNIVRWR